MKVSKVTAKNRWKGNQRRIGITGGIASGKSTVAIYLTNTKKIPILDADIFAKEALTEVKAIKSQVVQRYGERIISTKNDNKEINRLELGQIIFSDKNEKLWLESLIHPYVIKRFNIELSQHQHYSTVGLVIPLLFEASLETICSEVWLVYCTTSQQYKRLQHRNNFNYQQLKLRIESQLPMDYKKRLSDKIIDNRGSLESSHNQIDALLD